MAKSDGLPKYLQISALMKCLLLLVHWYISK